MENIYNNQTYSCPYWVVKLLLKEPTHWRVKDPEELERDKAP